jgi:hypothetical protein
VSTAIAGVLGSGPHGSLVVVASSGLVLLFALWWLCELEPSADGLSTRRVSGATPTSRATASPLGSFAPTWRAT